MLVLCGLELLFEFKSLLAMASFVEEGSRSVVFDGCVEVLG